MKTKKIFPIGVTALLIAGLFSACTNQKPEFSINYEKYELENGLTVIFHTDYSDPVVAVSLTAHVGSARELPGKTGFAHLFEHLLFNESENLGRGGLDNMSARVGGSGANGSTSNDRTNYFQTVPKDALEKMLWAEADKLGWFINTVTEPVLAKEKQVVKNEKRQNYDNRPYGHVSAVISENLYPKGHPYSWTVIGSLDDLQAATLQDVKDFYNTWYVPNNVTLVVAGDFDPAQAKEWVNKYFGEIKRGEEIPALEKQPVSLNETKKLFYEDNFARLPYLSLNWPGVPEYHPDSYALQILTDYLSNGQKAPLFKTLVKDMKVSSNVRLYSSSSELAGEISLSVMAFPDKDLDEVYDAVQVALNDFETNGISEKDLNRIKAGAESSFYRGLSSVMGKSSQLAHYNIFAGDPGFITEDISNLLEVTIQDVERVYDQYIRDKSFIATSFVPKGSAELALQGSQPAHIAEENILSSVETFDVDQVVEYEKTPSTFDRSIEPPYGESPETPVPQVWKKELANGLNIYGIENNEVPLVDLSIIVKGGMLVDHPNKVGVANLFGILMNKGTQNKTPAELEEAIEELGARISFRSGQENIRISVSCLAKNYSKTMDLLEEMMFEPRWDQTEFDLARASIKSSLEQQKGNPGSIGSNEYSKLIYGPQHIFSHNSEGSLESLEMITMQDLKDFYKNYFSQDEAILNFVGALDQETVVASLSDISNKWEAKPVSLPEYSVPKAPENSLVYLYDVPDAKQSIIYIGYPCMDVSDPDFYPASVMNYILGGGGFASRLTQVLRQEKGFTYGIRSGFSGSEIAGPFTISTSVKTSNTLEALILIQGILQDYADTFTEEDLEVTKSFLIKKNARAFETSGAKLDMLNQISTYGWSNDFIRQQEQIVRNMTVDQIRALAKKYIDPSRMLYLVVGDAKTQMDLLEELGYGKAISL